MFRYYFIALIIMAMLGASISLAYEKHKTRGLYSQLQKLEQQREELEIEWEQLRLEEQTLATASLLSAQVRSQLNMVIPLPESVVYLTEDGAQNK